LIEKGDAVYCFDIPSKRNRKLAKKPERLFGIDRRNANSLGWQDRLRFYWGDIRKVSDIEGALPGAGAVCHLAALIPPAADKAPGLAYDVNVNGTKALLAALASAKKSEEAPFLVFASSVAVYGDRVATPFIRTQDELKPSPGDEYGSQKVLCERLIRDSGLPALVLRLSYIVWRKKLAMDPLMFRMPLETSIEVCHTADAGLAFANATRHPEAAGTVLHVGGGPACRTSYRAYLEKMLSFFGLGGLARIPEAAFSRAGYHCGFLDTEAAQELLGYQRLNLDDYYAEVKEEARPLRALARPFAWAVRRAILKGSGYLPRRSASRGRALAGAARLARAG
jgi:nucleoside-diphosphate-sugar epimerase